MKNTSDIKHQITCEDCNGRPEREVYYDDSEIVAGVSICETCNGTGKETVTVNGLLAIYEKYPNDGLSELIEELRDKERESTGIYLSGEEID